MPEFRVDTDQVRNVAGQVRNGAGEIETQLAALRTNINSLQGGWEGTAARALQELYARWHSSAESLHETLVEIGQQMDLAAQEYDQSNQANTSRFTA